jgi:ribosome maturation protein SDO1
MTDVTARIKIKGKNYETVVDVDKALKLKAGKEVPIEDILAVDSIFYDTKKGLHVSEQDLKEAFGTTDLREATKKIIKQGEILVPKEYRDKEREGKKKQIVDFLSKYAIDPRSNNPHTAERISSAIDETGINIDNRSIGEQLTKIVNKIKKILPIKLRTKKLKVRIPAQYTGRIYGILQDYKENEEWLSNGDLQCTIELPEGLQDEFFDKLNSMTQGNAMTQEVSQEEK